MPANDPSTPAEEHRSTILFEQLKGAVPGKAEYELAAAKLVDRYTRRLSGFLRKRVQNPSDVEDILLIVLADVIRTVQQFDRQKGRPFGWMCGIARKKIVDFFRSPSHRPAGKAIDTSGFDRAEVGDELAALIERDRWETAEETVRATTNPSQWMCYDRVVNGNETDESLAIDLDLPPLTCARYRNRVRMAIEAEFKRLGEEEDGGK